MGCLVRTPKIFVGAALSFTLLHSSSYSLLFITLIFFYIFFSLTLSKNALFLSSTDMGSHNLFPSGSQCLISSYDTIYNSPSSSLTDVDPFSSKHVLKIVRLIMIFVSSGLERLHFKEGLVLVYILFRFVSLHCPTLTQTRN